MLKTTTETLLLVANGAVTEFDGDLDDYRAWLNQAESTPDAEPTRSLSVSATDRRDQKRQEAEARNALSAKRRPLENAVHAIEKEMERHHAEKTRLDGLLATDALYSEGRKDDLKRALRQQAEINARLRELEENWLLRQAELELP